MLDFMWRNKHSSHFILKTYLKIDFAKISSIGPIYTHSQKVCFTFTHICLSSHTNPPHPETSSKFHPTYFPFAHTPRPSWLSTVAANLSPSPRECRIMPWGRSSAHRFRVTNSGGPNDQLSGAVGNFHFYILMCDGQCILSVNGGWLGRLSMLMLY